MAPGEPWTCPVCGRGMAPWMPHCDCVKKDRPSIAPAKEPPVKLG